MAIHAHIDALVPTIEPRAVAEDARRPSVCAPAPIETGTSLLTIGQLAREVAARGVKVNEATLARNAPPDVWLDGKRRWRAESVLKVVETLKLTRTRHLAADGSVLPTAAERADLVSCEITQRLTRGEDPRSIALALKTSITKVNKISAEWIRAAKLAEEIRTIRGREAEAASEVRAARAANAAEERIARERGRAARDRAEGVMTIVDDGRAVPAETSHKRDADVELQLKLRANRERARREAEHAVGDVAGGAPAGDAVGDGSDDEVVEIDDRDDEVVEIDERESEGAAA